MNIIYVSVRHPPVSVRRVYPDIKDTTLSFRHMGGMHPPTSHMRAPLHPSTTERFIDKKESQLPRKIVNLLPIIAN